jgi:hypothetical protein
MYSSFSDSNAQFVYHRKTAPSIKKNSMFNKIKENREDVPFTLFAGKSFPNYSAGRKNIFFEISSHIFYNHSCRGKRHEMNSFL